MFKGISCPAKPKSRNTLSSGNEEVDSNNVHLQKTSRERSGVAQRPECEREKGKLTWTKRKKQKKQLLAERSVEGTSRLGLVRVSWKSADVGCTGSAAMAPGSMLSTYFAQKDFLVTVLLPCPLLMSAMYSHVISFTRLGLCCEVARGRSKGRMQAYGFTLHSPTPHSSSLDRRFDMIRYDSCIFMPHVRPCPVVRSRRQTRNTLLHFFRVEPSLPSCRHNFGLYKSNQSPNSSCGMARHSRCQGIAQGSVISMLGSFRT